MNEQPTNMPEAPECDKMLAVVDDSHIIGEFLDWLNDQGIHLAEYQDVEGYRDPMLMLRHESYERLLARFFGIDLEKVEQERRAILAHIQH